MDQREKSYLELLTRRFDESNYISFIKDLLNLSQFDISNTLEERKDIPKQYKENIDYYKYIAKYNDGINNIGILVVKLNDKTSTNARTSQRNFIATILSKYDLDASLVAFYSDTESSWRLSFVKKELNFTEKGFKIELTPAKRYSYLVGESESVHTAQEFLLKLLKINDRKIKLEDIEQVFDVEKVTKRFFEEYKEKFLQLKEYLDKNEDFKTESEKADFTSVEFAKKLMGQIVFLYFLQKKGWLGVQLVPNELNLIEFEELLNNSDSVSRNLLNKFYVKQENFYIIDRTKLKVTDSLDDVINLSNLFSKTTYDMPWGTGKKNFIRTIYKQAIKEHRNFFDDYLEPFFYKGLNEKRENQYFPLFNCKIPFLNGGLFEPINNYRWSSAYFNIPNSMFSNDNKDGILDFLDLYNFTIDEEEPLEKDVAVDPEMLGKIFENLLEVNDRKSKGAFYTPREVVYYMCQESLANYLVNKLNINYNEIFEFIKYGDLITQLDFEEHLKGNNNFTIGKSIYNNILKIDKALIDVKVADPAVGSGTFPLGMLTEIIKIRNNLSTYINIQLKLGVINENIIYNTEHQKRNVFDMKLQTIENSIYAVDIEPSAIDIAKLRLWLSLIVDYPNDEEPRPLPNLDCKILQGNSLIDEYEDVPLFSKKILLNNLKNYRRKESELTSVNEIHIQQTLQFDDTIDLNVYIDKMIDLQKEYFKTSDNRIKKELKKKIDDIQMGMIEESLKNTPEKLKRFQNEAQKRIKSWFVWELEFYDVFKNNGGFDIVIGNPPYFNVETLGANSSVCNVLKKNYSEIWMDKSDILFYFIYLGYRITNSQVNFITSNAYLFSDKAKKLRNFIIEKMPIKKLINFERYMIFSSASITSCITFFDKNSKDSVIKNISEDNILLKDVLYDDKNNFVINFEKNKPFALLQDSNRKILNKIERDSQKLENIMSVGSGMQTGCNKLFTFDSNFTLNSNYMKPIITGERLNKYYLSKPDSKTQYTLYVENVERFDDLSKDVQEYLLTNKNTLENRADKKRRKTSKWWNYTFPMWKDYYDYDKIWCSYRAKNNVFCLDLSKNNIGYTNMVPIFNTNSQINIKYILALLNSELLEYYHKNNSKQTGGGIYEYVPNAVCRLPIKFCSEEIQSKIVDLVDKILVLKDEDNSANIDELECKINDFVYTIYSITEEEKEEIKDYLNNN